MRGGYARHWGLSTKSGESQMLCYEKRSEDPKHAYLWAYFRFWRGWCPWRHFV